MGKADKGKKGKGDVVAKSGPLESQMFQSDFAKPSGRQKQRRTEEVEDRRRFVGSGMTAKILQQARLQNEEMLDEMTPDAPTASHTADKKGDKILSWTASKREKKLDSDEEELSDDAADDQFDGGRECEEIEINEEDEEAFNRFLSGDSKTKRTLADVIFDKITEKQTEVASQMSEVGPEVRELDPRLVEMYQGVRDVLSTYRSGKLPKAFKIIPKLSNWEQILYITEPEKWSAAAMYQATRIFASNLNAKMCQRFFNLVLLPRIRDDIAEYRRLNPHLYMALKKALFKPAAFFKGILLPLCESCTCTLREATLIGSVLTKCTIPVLHSAAAMLKIAEMEYSGANSIFLRILLDKKYALPYRVTDALVFHFLRFMGDQRVMTVLWHQSLLVFAQRYKQDLSEEQRESLLELLKKQSHEKITPEIRRELLHAVSRDQTEAVEKQQVRVVTDNPDMQIC